MACPKSRLQVFRPLHHRTMACMGQEDPVFVQWRELIDLRGCRLAQPCPGEYSEVVCLLRRAEGARARSKRDLRGRSMVDRSRCKLCCKQTSAGVAAIATTAPVQARARRSSTCACDCAEAPMLWLTHA